MRVAIWLLLNLSPIFKVVTGECTSPHLIFKEGYNVAEPPVKGIEKINLDRIGKVKFKLISDKNVGVKVKMEIMNIIEIDDQLSKLTFGVQLKLKWNEPRIKTLEPMLLMSHDFSKQCLWSPRIYFRNQISSKRQDLVQNDLPLKIFNNTDQVNH